MRFDVITLFPEMIEQAMNHSVIKRSIENGLMEVNAVQLRDFAYDKHKIVDDTPFGGGAGMLMKPEPFFRAVKSVIDSTDAVHRRVLLMGPGGSTFDQAKCVELAQYDQLIFLCGHYEGVDMRVQEHLVDEVISIGDYVLTGGELPAMVIIDAVARNIPGVLGSAESAPQDSFYHGLLEYPQYTRPREFEGHEVPPVLLSGNHAEIERWRRKQSLKLTKEKRPDLFAQIELSDRDKKLLQEIEKESVGES